MYQFLNSLTYDPPSPWYYGLCLWGNYAGSIAVQFHVCPSMRSNSIRTHRKIWYFLLFPRTTFTIHSDYVVTPNIKMVLVETKHLWLLSAPYRVLSIIHLRDVEQEHGGELFSDNKYLVKNWEMEH